MPRRLSYRVTPWATVLERAVSEGKDGQPRVTGQRVPGLGDCSCRCEVGACVRQHWGETQVGGSEMRAEQTQGPKRAMEKSMGFTL